MSAIETPAAEDLARANFYALLSRLFADGPDAALLASIARSGREQGGDSPLARAWQALAVACNDADANSAAQEHVDLFVGTGQAKVTPYLSYYLVPSGHEMVLVRLRAELAGLGLAAAGSEPEDHIAALLEIMRHLALSGAGDIALHKQRAIFKAYLAPAYPRFCAAVESSGGRFYPVVVRLLRAFLEVESEALEMS